MAGSPSEPLEATSADNTVILNFQPPELREKKTSVVSRHQLVALCGGSPSKLIQRPLKATDMKRGGEGGHSWWSACVTLTASASLNFAP